MKFPSCLACVLVPIFAIAATSCRDDKPSLSPSPDSGASDAPDVSDDARSSASATICDGDPAVRFAYIAAGGGQVLPGAGVLSENGFAYFIVNGQCHYWAMRDTKSDIREGQLSAVQEAELADAAHLGDWSELVGEYVIPVCDGTGAWFRFRDERIRISAVCHARPTAEPVLWLRDEVRTHLSSAWEAGQPVTGSVRYVLVADPESLWSSSVSEAAAAWPLDVPSASVAMPLTDASSYQPGMSQLASEEADAAALRTIRRTFVETGKLPLTGGYLPVMGDDGAHYQLFVRDSIPLEDSSGLLHVF